MQVWKRVLVICGLVSVGACKKENSGLGIGSDAQKPPPSWSNSMRSEQLANELQDFIQGRELPRGFTSLAQGPDLALGSVYVIRAKKGKTCDSTDSNDFEDSRMLDFRKRDAGCIVKAFEKVNRKDETVKGSAKGNLDVVVGRGNVDVELVYQLTFEDTSVTFETPRECIDLVALGTAQLPANTCSAKFIVGAVLTTVTWRAFEKFNASAKASYLSLVKVDAEMFGSTSRLTTTPVLSFDSIDLETLGLLAKKTDGTLSISPKAKSPETLQAAANLLADPAKVHDATAANSRWDTMFAPEMRTVQPM